MKKLLICLLMTSFVISANENIFENMSKETANITGLYKLSSKEKQELLKWLQATNDKSRAQIKDEIRQETKQEMSKEIAEEIIKKDKKQSIGFRNDGSDNQEINSSIVGEFTGWQGKTVFTLANGQKWKQSQKSSYYTSKRNNPDITLKPKFMGSWTMYIDGLNRGVKVKRIK